MLLLLLVRSAHADEVVYADSLGAGWDDWSWSASCNDVGDDVYAGTASLACTVSGWGALSLHRASGFGGAGALSFAFEGEPASVALVLEADGDGATESIPMTDLVAGSAWAVGVLDLSAHTGHAWTRFDVMDTTGSGAEFRLDQVELLTSVPAATSWTAAEPVALDTLELQGGGDPDAVTVTLDGTDVPVTAVTAGDGRSWLTLGTTLHAGTLVVETADGRFTRTLASASATVASAVDHTIPDAIYGQAFTEPDQIGTQGVSVVRWGGNAVTLYNPDAGATNLANDWYFENSDASSAADWIREVHGAGAAAFLTVPALDWVAKDTSSCAYSVAKYGPQEDVDEWRPDCGDGVTSGGTEITWNDPADAATPWSSAQLGDWLGSLSEPPDVVAIDNEMDIAGSTHRDVHPDPVDYDELFDRWYTGATAVRAAVPTATITGPSSCCWWYYWNDDAATKDAHGGVDLLPWWLAQVAAADAANGTRTLDVFDIHYYPAQDGVFSDAVDDTTRALRLRSTRALWDPTYTDESWIGTDVWATQTQPSPNEVQLIPRFRTLLDELYPGTAFAIGEWNFGAESDVSGGLAAADVLGIFGREGVDLATYWTSPGAGTPAAAAFTLYRDPAAPFGDGALPVTFDDPDHLGVYAALGSDGRTTVVVVNKSPDTDLVLSLAGVATGTATVRRFGGAVDGEVEAEPATVVDGVVVVPAYSAFFYAVGEGSGTGGGGGGAGGGGGSGTDDSGSGGGTGEGGGAEGDTGGPGDTAASKSGDGCGCSVGAPSPSWLLLPGALLVLRRRGVRHAQLTIRRAKVGVRRRPVSGTHN